MAERGDPEQMQVIGGQRRQQARVDVVIAERLLVPAQAQPAQPSPDVHLRSPDQACSSSDAAHHAASPATLPRYRRLG